jgi:CheY-like chemotaxis protein
MENNYGRTILLVDDLAIVRKWMRTCLQQAGYPVIEAASGAEAIDLFQQCETRIALVVSDVQMPAMSGVDLAERLLRLRPDLPILFVSGHCGALPQKMRGFSFLPKPFRMEELIGGVEHALTSSNILETK